MNTTYELHDTFNGSLLSRHKSIRNAVRAEFSHARAVERRNGKGSYLTYVIRASDGSDLGEQVAQLREEIATSWR